MRLTTHLEPHRGPVGAMSSDQGLELPAHLVNRLTLRCREERECNGAKAKLEQPAPARRLDIVVTLGRRGRDRGQLASVETEIVIQLRRGRSGRVRVREIHPRRAGLDHGVAIGELRQLRRRLRREHHRGVVLAEREQPLIDPCAEHRVYECEPRFVDLDQRRPAVEPLFDSPKEIQQHRERDLVVERKKMPH